MPGGLNPEPQITNVTRSGSTVNLGWWGVERPYQVQGTPALPSTNWTNLGSSTPGTNASVTVTADVHFFRVQGANPNYIGITNGNCRNCHGLTFINNYHGTRHARAFETLQGINQHTNPYCLKCHTVGLGFATGYQNLATTPSLSDVQCENCHGPAGTHRSNASTIRPVVTIAAELCGGCHNGEHHPTYDEWLESAHGAVTPEVAATLLSGGEPSMMRCGPCHSGAVRKALLDDYSSANLEMPGAGDAAHFGIVCANCHNPHATNAAAPKQLRNPVFSTNFFSYVPGTNLDSFATQYVASVQICGQCHNMRGAAWPDTSRPPHHSPQYNILIGLGGYNNSAALIASHGSKNTNQCTQCHSHAHDTGPAAAIASHALHVSYGGCAAAGCHATTNEAMNLKLALQLEVTNRISQVKSNLDLWATTKGAALGLTNGLANWEYTSNGELSTRGGPPTAQQALIPSTIKQARFNLYLVRYDGSLGTHNGTYARFLLDVAQTNVLNALAAP